MQEIASMDYPIRTISRAGASGTSEDVYPPSLHEIPEPPDTLHLRGAVLPELRNPIAIVGARRHSSYGTATCERLVSGLAGLPITIISGLAIGIDALAHKAALDNAMHTVAVIGSGLDDTVLYPATNRRLAYAILASGGTLVSEYPGQARAAKHTFPERNRIIAGMAKLVLVIECEERSGTRITARLGTEYGKDVCAVPQSIFSETGKGANLLIQQGAHLVQSSNDIIELLGIDLKRAESGNARETLTKTERLVYDTLATPKTKTQLAEATRLPTSTLQATLTTLEMKQLVSEVMGLVQRK